MAYAQPDLEWIPANEANYMSWRNGTPVRHIAYHHVVGPASSAIARFQQPSQVSAHFVVASDRIYCMVDTDDTAFCNGVWASNLESVCIEHEGDWRNGYRNEGVIQQSAILTAWLRSLYPEASPIRHRDVMATACPGDLPVEEIWDRATTLLNPPKPAPTTPEWLKNRKAFSKTMYVQVGNTQLWNLDNPSQPADGRLFAVNTEVKIGSKTTVGGQDYYITEYSTGKNIGAGYRAVSLADKPYHEPAQPPVNTQPEPVPAPPVPPATPPTPTPPVIPVPEPKEEEPVVVSPTPGPSQPDVVTSIKTVIVNMVVTFFQAFLSVWGATGFNPNKVALGGAIGAAASLVWNTILKPFLIKAGLLKQ